MIKSEFIEKVAGKTSVSLGEVSKVINAAIELVGNELVKGEKVTLTGFGTFEVRLRAARKGRNPRTGEEIELKASKLPSFKAGRGLKEKVNR